MLPARTLTFQFDPVVGVPGAPPQEWEVTLAPLSSPADGTTPDATLVGAGRTQRFLMSATTPVDVPFAVVPSDAPGLSTTVWYRAGWRPRFFGKLTTYDFTMPDADVAFDDLQDLGKILGAEVYLRQSDVGVHVAELDAQGFVLDGNQVRVGVDDSAAIAAVNQERIDRQNADNGLRTNLENELVAQVNQTLATATTRIATAVGALQSADVGEAAARIAAVAAFNEALAGVEADLNADVATLSGIIAAHTATLVTKADLVGGKLATDQLPTLGLITAVPAANQAAMLALSSAQVQPGDLCVRPDGSYLLLSNPPATLGNWIRLSTGAGIQQINGQSGDVVVLTAANVGAIAIGAMLPQSQVTNLIADLAAKAATTTVTGINSRLATVEADTTIVRTVAAHIAKALLPIDVVFVDGSGLLRKQDGTLITTGGPDATVDWSQLVDVPATFAPTIGTTSSTAVAGNDTRLTNTRIPTSHAASHVAAGTDPLTLSIAQVSTLGATLTSLGNRTSSLETRVTDVESGGGGGGGTSAKTLWFDAATAVTGITDVADFAAAPVAQKGPFGQASDASYYYDPAGAADGEWRYPVITKNGHLQLREWDETNPPDPDMASQAELDALAVTVATKADGAATSSALALKADASVVTTLAGTVATKADGSVVSALATTVAGKADATATTAALALKADATALTSGLALKADATTVATLSSTVSGKADAAATTAALATKADATATTSALAAKADAAAMTSALALKADASTTTAALATKADLVGGKLASSQIPALALNDTYPVANRAGMLALTSTQVQIGDVAVITATADQGSYIFTGSNPATFTDWTLMASAADAVQSVNGQTGNPVLSAADVNARSASTAVPLTDVSGLSSALANKVDTTTYTTGLAGKTSPTDVQGLLTQAANGPLADVAATTNIALTGTFSIDGVLVSVGQRVLATAQTSSINNGLYVVAAGGWARATDMNTAEFFTRGKLVIVASGSANANSVWTQTGSSGLVGTAANNWVKSLTAGPPLVYTAAANSGLTITGTAIVVKPNTGISVTSAGVGADRNLIPFKFAGDVPSGSATVTITHGLGTQDLSSVTVMDKATRVMNTPTWAADTTNTIVLEFPTAPTTGQWRVVVTA